MKKIALALYYLVGRFLPRNEAVFFGRLSCYIRRFLATFIFKKIGRQVNINKNAYFGNGGNIEIGDFSGIGERCQLANDVIIGADVLMAPDVIIFSVNHEYRKPSVKIRLQGNMPARKVVIEDNVWIGQRSIILPGVTIGTGAIIGAGSVVTKNVPANCIVAGNPARIVKENYND